MTINKRFDASATSFAQRRLDEPSAYLIIDAKYEKVRQAGVVRSCAVLVALGVDWEGRRQILAVELADSESGSSRKADDDCLQELRWIYDRRAIAGLPNGPRKTSRKPSCFTDCRASTTNT